MEIVGGHGSIGVETTKKLIKEKYLERKTHRCVWKKLNQKEKMEFGSTYATKDSSIVHGSTSKEKRRWVKVWLQLKEN